MHTRRTADAGLGEEETAHQQQQEQNAQHANQQQHNVPPPAFHNGLGQQQQLQQHQHYHQQQQQQQQQASRQQHARHDLYSNSGTAAASVEGAGSAFSDYSHDSHDGQSAPGEEKGRTTVRNSYQDNEALSPTQLPQQKSNAGSANISAAESRLPPTPSAVSPTTTAFAVPTQRSSHLAASSDVTGGASTGSSGHAITSTISLAQQRLHHDHLGAHHPAPFGSYFNNPQYSNSGQSGSDGYLAPHSQTNSGGGNQVHPPLMQPFSAPASVTTFPGTHSTVPPSPLAANGSSASHMSNYFSGPYTSSAAQQSFMVQQQQQQQHAYSQHGHMGPSDGMSNPYLSPPQAFSGGMGADLTDSSKSSSAQQQQQMYANPLGHTPNSAGGPRRSHPTARGTPGGGYQPYCVPSQNYRTSTHNFHPGNTHAISQASIFTANPDALPDLRFTDRPLQTGSHYGRLPNGKIIELFPAMMRTVQACEYCRSRKAKCTGGLPCERCQKKSIKCEYAQLDKKRKVKTTTSEYDMSGGVGGGGGGSISVPVGLHAQALLSAKVGVAVGAVKPERNDAEGKASGEGRSNGDAYQQAGFTSSSSHGWSSAHGHSEVYYPQQPATLFAQPALVQGNTLDDEHSSDSQHFSSHSQPYGHSAAPREPASYGAGVEGDGRYPRPMTLRQTPGREAEEERTSHNVGLYT